MTGRIIAASYWYQGPDSDGPRRLHGYTFWCPGCEDMHSFTTDTTQKVVWSFNGDLDKPTFSPSLGVKDYDEVAGKFRDGYKCHLLLKDGVLRFLSDCKHPLAGQTVPVPPHPDDDPEHPYHTRGY